MYPQVSLTGVLITLNSPFLIIGTLPHKEWPPLTPPIQFPSSKGRKLEDDLEEDRGDHEFLQKYNKKMDLNSIPFDGPPPVKNYPILEDQSHEEFDNHKIDEL